MKHKVIEWIYSLYTESGIIDERLHNNHAPFWALGLLIACLLICLIIWVISNFLLVQLTFMFFDRTKTKWDDYLLKNKFFKALAHLIPLLFAEYLLSIVFYHYPKIHVFIGKLVGAGIVFTFIFIINRFLSSFKDILSDQPSLKDKPIQSYIQVGKITVSIILGVVILSILTGIKPSTFLASLGAASAVVLLIFKDTILGFVGSLQLGANDLVRIGDWITMTKHGADGTVEEISLTAVKVRNFDKTITTIPTYSLVSDSFKNWRGMEESDGRRIKRLIRINIDSIKFAGQELCDRLKKIEILRDFIIKREQEIQKYNEENGFTGENAINGRKQTNIGLFRKYIEHYLQHKIEINNAMTLMVRQLEPTDTGIPLEIYCFTKTKIWTEYESIQADVFDHVLAMVHIFELQIFEKLSGNDLKAVAKIPYNK